ncbi:MAG: class I adenylate-forming enzyme family protein, partial [Acidobacteriota bacterium]
LDPTIECSGDAIANGRAELARETDAWRQRAADWPAPVGVAVGNHPDVVSLFLALSQLGKPMVALEATRDIVGLAAACGLPTVVRRGSESSSVDDGSEPQHLEVEAAATPPGTVLVKRTSGSTGVPTGVCFDAPSLLAGVRQIAAGMDLSADDRVLLSIPLNHSYGFDNGVLSLAVLGTPLILQPSPLPRPMLRAIHDTEATVLPIVPPLVRALAHVRWPTHQLRRVISAGGRLPPQEASAFHRASGRPVHNFYGSSESGGLCFETDPLAAGSVGTVGQPLPGVEIKLAGGGETPGTVVASSAANRIGRLGSTERLEDRRVRPGDLAEWTEDGRLRLLGRADDVLNVAGRKVRAGEMEAALGALDGVSEAAVVAVEDAARGDLPIAFVVADRWPICSTRLPDRLMPRRLYRLDALPITARGKLDRADLRRRAQAAQRPSVGRNSSRARPVPTAEADDA